MNIPLLTPGESKVYIALVELGQTTIGNILKHSKVSHSKVYDILKRLESKGLVSRITKQGIMRFSAQDPAQLNTMANMELDTLKRKKRQLQSVIAQLKMRQSTLPSAHIMRSFEGMHGMKAMLEELLNMLKKGDEVLIYGTPKQIVEKSGGYLKQWQQSRIKKKARCRILADTDAPSWSEEWWVQSKNKLTWTKKQKKTAPAYVIISNDTVLTIYYAGAILTIALKHEGIAQRYKSMFEQVWLSS